MKRVLNISLWAVSILAVAFLLAFTNFEHSGVVCSSVKININRSVKENRFLDSTVIMKQFADKQLKLVGEKLANINLAQLEDELKNRPDVVNAQVFATIDGHLEITLTERKPILRVINMDGDSYYIDSEGELMPLSDRYTAHVPVATGLIAESYSVYYTYGVKGIEEHEALKGTAIIDDLYHMALYMQKDSLWNAQIDQLNVLPKNELALVPKIGNGTIAFGTPTDMDEKFDKLRAFYKHAIAAGTFNGYQTINLKYKNQVVCTKKQ